MLKRTLLIALTFVTGGFEFILHGHRAFHQLAAHPSDRHPVLVLTYGMLRAAVFVFVLVALPCSAVGQDVKAPSLTLKSIEGRTVRLSDYRGKVILINFWATWCPPCRAEMPDLIKMQREYRSKGLQVIGITYPPEEIEEVKQFIRKLKVNYPIALGTKETKILFDKTETLPLTVVIDRQGNVRERIEGILLAEEFEQKIKPLLK